MDPLTDLRSRRRAATRLATFLLALVVVAGAVIALVVAHNTTTATPSPPSASLTSPPEVPVEPVEPGWDRAAETALATRPMPVLPATAAQPHELTTQTAGPDIVLPTARVATGRWIADAFPQTAEGALAQLKAINEAGVDGGDPDTFTRAYQQFALPAAPAADRSGLRIVLTHFRDRSGIPAGQVRPGLAVTYDVTHGLIKGTTDGGRYVVACTLGQLSVTNEGHTTVLGIGDCQALRWTGTGWRISPGARAAYAPSAWPGSGDSVAAGYRALAGGPR